MLPMANSKTGGMIAPGCATRSAPWLAASGLVGYSGPQPMHHVEVSSLSVISCQSLQLNRVFERNT